MTLRATALLACAAFTVHELRYLLVPDPGAAVAHGYLTTAAPAVLVFLLALAAGRSIAAIGRRRLAARPRWLAASAALLGLHVVQEALERVLAGGGPVDAGWLLVVPLCLIAGALVARALWRVERLLGGLDVARAPRLPAAPALPRAALPQIVLAASPAPLAHNLAGRAPPACFG